MIKSEFEQICINGEGVSDAIDMAINYIEKSRDFELNAEYLSRISQQIIIDQEDGFWRRLLSLCEVAEISSLSKEALGYIYKTFINYYNYMGLSPKVVEYTLKYQKLRLSPINNYEIYNMASYSFYDTGFYDKAIEYILKSQEAFDNPEVDSIFKAMSYNNLVYCYSAINRMDKVLETYNKLREVIECELSNKKRIEMNTLFRMCTFFVQLKMCNGNEEVLKTVFDKYLEYLEDSNIARNVGVLESEDVHLPFIDFLVRNGKLSKAEYVCEKLIYNNNISGSKKQIYNRLITIYQLMGREVDKQKYFDLVIEYNSILENYNFKFDEIMHELVDEQFRIAQIEEKYIELQSTYNTDSLTACLNRKAFDDFIDNPTYETGVVIFIDLDYLKSINDKYGHNNGDIYIRYFSYIASNLMDFHAEIFRYGGDEFVIIGGISLDTAKRYIERLKGAFNEPCRLIDNSVYLHFSFGICEFGKGKNLKESIKIADSKMYENKGSKRR